MTHKKAFIFYIVIFGAFYFTESNCECKGLCQDGEYLKQQKCFQCPLQCNRCNYTESTGVICIDCYRGYNTSQGLPSCNKCYGPCETCLGNIEQCLTCMSGYKMKNNTCQYCTACPGPIPRRKPSPTPLSEPIQPPLSPNYTQNSSIISKPNQNDTIIATTSSSSTTFLTDWVGLLVIGVIFAAAIVFCSMMIKIRPRVGFDENSSTVIMCRRSVETCTCFKRCPRSYRKYIKDKQQEWQRENEAGQMPIESNPPVTTNLNDTEQMESSRYTDLCQQEPEEPQIKQTIQAINTLQRAVPVIVEEQKITNICRACRKNQVCFQFLPCGHLVCSSCEPKSKKLICHQCKKPFSQSIQIQQ